MVDEKRLMREPENKARLEERKVGLAAETASEDRRLATKAEERKLSAKEQRATKVAAEE